MSPLGTRCTDRTARKRCSAVEHRRRLPGMVNISERPAETEERSVLGHWQGDLILGQGGRRAVDTLVEWTTGWTRFSTPKTAAARTASMSPRARRSPPSPTNSAGRSPGTTTPRWPSTPPSRSNRAPDLLCDPHASSQRGSKENSNGLLRRCLPTSTDLSKHTAAGLVEVQRGLSGGPRKTLGHLSPSAAYAQHVATTRLNRPLRISGSASSPDRSDRPRPSRTIRWRRCVRVGR